MIWALIYFSLTKIYRFRMFSCQFIHLIDRNQMSVQIEELFGIGSFVDSPWISSEFLFLNLFVNISESNVKTKECCFRRNQTSWLSWCVFRWILGSLIVFLLNLR